MSCRYYQSTLRSRNVIKLPVDMEIKELRGIRRMLTALLAHRTGKTPQQIDQIINPGDEDESDQDAILDELGQSQIGSNNPV